MHKSWNQKTTAFHLDGNVLHQWIRVIWNDLSCRTWNFSVHRVWIWWNSIVWIVDLNFMTWPNVLSAEISTSSLGVRRTVKLAETPNPTAACKPWKRIDWSTVVTGYLARNSVWIMMIDNDDFQLASPRPCTTAHALLLSTAWQLTKRQGQKYPNMMTWYTNFQTLLQRASTFCSHKSANCLMSLSRVLHPGVSNENIVFRGWGPHPMNDMAMFWVACPTKCCCQLLVVFNAVFLAPADIPTN